MTKFSPTVYLGLALILWISIVQAVLSPELEEKFKIAGDALTPDTWDRNELHAMMHDDTQSVEQQATAHIMLQIQHMRSVLVTHSIVDMGPFKTYFPEGLRVDYDDLPLPFATLRVSALKDFVEFLTEWIDAFNAKICKGEPQEMLIDARENYIKKMNEVIKNSRLKASRSTEDLIDDEQFTNDGEDGLIVERYNDAWGMEQDKLREMSPGTTTYWLGAEISVNYDHIVDGICKEGPYVVIHSTDFNKSWLESTVDWAKYIFYDLTTL